jgi:hypothetical protein
MSTHKTITISLPTKKSKSNKKISNTENYIEVKPKYLKYLYGTWVKFYNKISMVHSPGGFITKIDQLKNYVYLRNVQGEILEISIKENKWLCKNDTESYYVLQEIIRDIEEINLTKKNNSLLQIELNNKMINLEHQQQEFNKKLIEFEKQKTLLQQNTKMLENLVYNGKIKILK